MTVTTTTLTYNGGYLVSAYADSQASLIWQLTSSSSPAPNLERIKDIKAYWNSTSVATNYHVVYHYV